MLLFYIVSYKTHPLEFSMNIRHKNVRLEIPGTIYGRINIKLNLADMLKITCYNCYVTSYVMDLVDTLIPRKKLVKHNIYFRDHLSDVK